MADPAKKPEPPKDAGLAITRPDDAFRRQAALALACAYLTRHGGFGDGEVVESNLRRVWEYATLFVELEHAPPLPPAKVETPPRPPARPTRRATPTDEWAVRDGTTYRRGFTTFEEAEFYATGRAGAEIVQVGGPEVQAVQATM